MRQAQQMQDKLKKAQEALAELSVEGQAGSGLVKVVMTGKHQLRSVSIDPSLMTTDPDDRETLQDLIAAAFSLSAVPDPQCKGTVELGKDPIPHDSIALKNHFRVGLSMEFASESLKSLTYLNVVVDRTVERDNEVAAVAHHRLRPAVRINDGEPGVTQSYTNIPGPDTAGIAPPELDRPQQVKIATARLVPNDS